MKVNVTATRSWTYKDAVGIERKPIEYGDLLGVRVYESLDAAIMDLMEKTKELEYVVSFEDGMWQVEIYNNYRE